MERNRTDIDQSGFETTQSGFGIWTGLLPVAREIYLEYSDQESDFEHQDAVDQISRQHDRYQWFAGRITHPRRYRRLSRILSNPPDEPSAWERAMVELTLLDSTEAELFLQTWEAPDDDREIDTFRRVCLAKM